MSYLPIIAGLSLFIVSGPSLFALGLLVCHVCKVGVRNFFSKFPTEDLVVVNKLMRCIQTMPGDSLQAGIRRAFVLSIEHGPVVMIHQGIPIVVSEYITPHEAEKRWTATGKMYQRREVCEGK
jgi:hypothetical protein